MKNSKKLLSLLLALALVFALCTAAFAAPGELEGKMVILHTNDVHGAIAGYAKVAALKAEYEAKGAEVALVDAGDYIQGTTYVSSSQGAAAIEMMNAAGYDLAVLGNHEFDYGYENLKNILAKAEFKVSSDVYYNGELAFDAAFVGETENGLKIGFFGLETPETATKAHPAKIKGVTFLAEEALYDYAQTVVDSLKKDDGCDIVICIAHLGVDDESKPNRSYDLYANTTGIDFIIDGHSHTVMTKGANDEPIQSTGTALANVGVIVIGDKGIEDNYLVDLSTYEKEDENVKAVADRIIADVKAEYGAVFAKSEVELNGNRAPGNRTEETNLGDLITDAILWYATKDGGLEVPAENVVALTNGGGIRAAIKAGDITKNDINTVLPFGNTVAYVTVTGETLLEALEASTYSTPTAIGGFPQVAGIDFTIDTTKDYDANAETYPGSTYYGPKSINRVTINSINGKAFDPKATYLVVTNDFLAAGGDTYYAFSISSVVDTGVAMDVALMEYINTELGGVVGEKYAKPQGRIKVVEAEPFTDVGPDDWFYDAVVTVYQKELMNGVSETTFEPNTNMSRAMLVTMLYRLAGSPEVEGKVSEIFSDCADDIWYSNAIIWAQTNKIVDGMGDGTFAPNASLTRQQMAKILYGYKSLDGEIKVDSELKFTDADAIADWARAGVAYCVAEGIMNGVGDNVFDPTGAANRAMGATVLARLAA